MFLFRLLNNGKFYEWNILLSLAKVFNENSWKSVEKVTVKVSKGGKLNILVSKWINELIQGVKNNICIWFHQKILFLYEVNGLPSILYV